MAERPSLKYVCVNFVNPYKPSVLFVDICKQCRPRPDATERGV